MREQDEIFLARSDEVDRLRGVLRQVLDAPAQPGRSFLVLVHGQGGIGKSTLLKRYRRIARGEVSSDRGFRGRFLLAKLNWEELRRAAPSRYPPGGPPLWIVLHDIYRAVIEGADAAGGSMPKQASKAFERFRELAAAAKDAQVAAEQGTPVVDIAEMAVGQLASLGSLTPIPYASQAADAVKQATHIAADATRRSRRGRISDDRYLRLIDPDNALVRTFGDALHHLSAKRPIVISMDTVEILEDGLVRLSGAIASSGSKVVWLVGARLENDARDNRVVGPFLDDMPSDSLRLIVPNRFTRRDIDDYLRETETRTGARLPQEIASDAVERVTHGIPLAVQLVVESVKAGMAPAEAMSEVTATGEVSATVRALAERYLMHVRSADAHEANPDLALIYGLALLEGSRDPRVLAALWDVSPAEVGSTKNELRRHHDFVLAGAPWLHQEVRDTIRLFLLDPDERARVRPANERATAELHTQLTEFGLDTGEAQLGSDQWCATAAALLWHTLWIDDRRGLALLSHLLPAAMLIRPALGDQMLRTAAWFAPVFPAELRARVNGLQALANVSRFMMQLRDMLDEASGTRAGTAPWTAAVMDDLARGCRYPQPVLADDVSAETLLDMLRVAFPRTFVVSPTHRVELLVSVDAALTEANATPGRLWRWVAIAAEQLSIYAANAVQSGAPDGSAVRNGLQLADIAVGRYPERPQLWDNLAFFRRENGDMVGSLAAADQAVSIDKQYAAGHVARGIALRRLGNGEEALRAYDDALRVDPGAARTHKVRGYALGLMSRPEDAVAAYTRALELEPSSRPTHINRGEQFLVLGRTEEAIADLRKAIDLGDKFEARALLALAVRHAHPEEAHRLFQDVLDADGHKNDLSYFRCGELRAWAHLVLGDPDAAETELRAVATSHQPDDLFVEQEYELLADVPGLKQLRAVWEDIG